jgi:copper transport protein
MRAKVRLTVAGIGGLIASLAFAATALGHADLVRTEPRQGQVLERPPRTVVLTFNEGIDPGLVRLQVTDADGRRVDRGEMFHPGGREEIVSVRVATGAAGTYVARFRVISDDGHPVAKRLSFRVRPKPADDEAAQATPAPAEEAPPPSAMPPEESQHLDAETGDVTDVGFAVTRAIGYLAIALSIGGVLFLFVAWLPAVAQVATGRGEWVRVSATFARRLRRVVLGSVAVGLVATALAIVLEAATAAGVSFWAALDPDALDSVSETRPVRAWSLRILVWLVLGALLLVTLRPQRMPAVRRAALGAEGTAMGPAPGRLQLFALGGAAVGLALTAPLAGHAGGHSPRGLLLCSDTMHVLCMSAWLGGLVVLLIALAIAGRNVPGPERTPLMAVMVGRFSWIARIAVGLLLLTGVIQSIVLVGSFRALVDTEYGLLVLAKIALFTLLIGLGAYNQRWMLPRLRRLAAGGEQPGRAAGVLRQAVALEVGFAVVVIAVTSVLVVTQPASPG